MTQILIAVNIAVLLVLAVVCIRETRNVNGHIRNLTAAMQMERWYATIEDHS